MTPAGIEAGEFRLKAEGTTTIGRVDRDIVFPEDTFLSESHASISVRDGQYVLRDDGSRAGTYLRVRSDKPMRVRDGSLIRAGHQILVVSAHTRGEPPHVEHYDANGTQIGAYPLRDTTVFGRSGGRSDPNVVLDDSDHTLSRFHMAVIVDHDGIWVQDFGSRNGTYVKVDDQQPIEHGDIIRIGSQQLEVRLREELPEKKSSKPVVAPPPPSVQDVPPPPPPAPARPAAAAAAAVASGPHVSFAGQNKGGPIDPSESLLKWADEHEVSIDYECWIGMCGCDAIRIVSGQEHLNPVTEKEIKTLKRRNLEPGKCRLACMTKASGPVVVEVV
jgi:pSer/pThr/pTyr-binding forkhead associated (FHA) protein